jgi:hypothetical protein
MTPSLAIDGVVTAFNTALPLRAAESASWSGSGRCVMENSRPHRFANRVGGEGGFEEECPPCKLIDVGNAKRYLPFAEKAKG